MGILMAPQCVYVLYNTRNGVLKWEYRTEVRLNAFLQHYLQGYPYNGHPQIRAIMTGNRHGNGFPAVYQYRRIQKRACLCWIPPMNISIICQIPGRETLFKTAGSVPEIMKKLDKFLLSDLGSRSQTFPSTMMGWTLLGTPVLAYDFDLHRINRFNTGLNVYGRSGMMICFDFQIPGPEKIS